MRTINLASDKKEAALSYVAFAAASGVDLMFTVETP